MTGKLTIASLGPGDPGLITRAAWQALQENACWAYPAKKDGTSYALGITQRAGLEPPARALPLVFPMTRDPQVLAESWQAIATEVAGVLQDGTDMVFLVEGDASSYATSGHLERTLATLLPDARVERIAGVPSYNASAAATGFTLAESDEALTVVSAPDGVERLADLVEQFDTVVFFKVRPVLDGLIDAMRQHGVLDGAIFVERVGTPEERIVHDVAALAEERVHYLSLVLLRTRKAAE